MRRFSLHTGLISLTLLLPAAVAQAAEPQPSRESESLDYDIKLETILKHDDGKFIWFHPRVAPIALDGSYAQARFFSDGCPFFFLRTAGFTGGGFSCEVFLRFFFLRKSLSHS